MATRGLPRHHRQRRIIALGVTAAVALGACTSDNNGGSATSTTHPDGSPTTSTPDNRNHGTSPFQVSGVRLSKGAAQGAIGEAVPVVDGTPLDDPSVQAVVDRLPEWTTDGDPEPFNWPAESIHAPLTGATVGVPFPNPTPEPPVDVATGPLHVLRMQPEGDVEIAPFVSVTFDQPMVPVATVGQLAADDVPASITPAVPGHWQWIGTRTLRFDADSDLIDRLPMATDYTVTIPAGTTSVSGGVLDQAVTWQFSTPPVGVESFQPADDSSLGLTPVFVATFDQRIDPAAVLATVVVEADGQQQTVRLATDEEVHADASVQQLTDSVADGRWIAFRPVDPLPADATITIDVGPGTPSAEGPLATESAAHFSDRTYAPLSVSKVDCGFGAGCVPGTEIDITMNNALEAATFDPATIVVDPAIPGAVIGTYGDIIVIRGNTAGNTTYDITLPAGLTDVFGQQLGHDDTQTVTTGSARPLLQQFPLPFTTLDPFAGHPSVSVVSMGHSELRVRVFGADPNEWPGFMEAASAQMYGDNGVRPTPPWPVLLDTTVEVSGDPQTSAETAIDLSGQLANGLGHVIVMVEPTEVYAIDSPDYWMNRPTVTWVQSTNIGLDAFADFDEVRAWTTDLGTGAPIAGATVQLVGTTATSVSDKEGLATLALPSRNTTALLAALGDDTALLPNGYYGGSWQKSPLIDNALWYVFDDRQTYRPGETVSVKGWVRRLTSSADSQLELWGSAATVSFTARDAQSNVIAQGSADVNPLGGFDLTFDIPDGANLGSAMIEFDLSGVDGIVSTQFMHPYQIAEFRRPEFEVAARPESTGPYVKGAPLTVAVDADYYAGGPLPAAPVDWRVTTAAALYSPPGWDEFSFGRWTPWWYEDFGPTAGMVDGPCCGPIIGNESDVQEFTGTTDADGTHYLQIEVGDLGDDLQDLPVTVTSQATVEDANRQAWSASTSVLVHPAALYVGLGSERTFVRRGEPLVVNAIVTDIDGHAVAGRSITVTASRSESVFENGSWIDRPVDTQTCEITSSTEPMPCSFTTSEGGTYEISSTVVDDDGRSNLSELTRWVSGADAVASRTLEQQTLTIVPDQAEYKPGDTAELLVQAPFDSGHGILTVVRGGIASTNTFEVADGSAVLQLPIVDADIPNLDVSIEVVGATQRTADDGSPLPDAPQRPAFASGGLTLRVSTASRALTVTAAPKDEQTQPGTTTQVDVAVVDAAGNPVAGSELAVVVVDEAVLALSGYALQDPLAAFYAQLPSQLAVQLGRQSIVLVDPKTLTQSVGGEATADTGVPASAPGSDGMSASTTVPADREMSAAYDSAGGAPALESPAPNAAPPIDVRTDFDALAVFAPDVVTDASGHAVVDVPLPDNLTRYRVMVVAVADAKQFGSAESNITARLPLMVRPSAPRFLNFGDEFQLPVLVQNQTDTAMDVDVVLQTANLDPSTPTGRRVSVPANDRVEVRFPVSAAAAGTARFRVSAVSGDMADSAAVDLPVYTPTTTEAFATYGVIDDGAILQPVSKPEGVVPQFGGLDISTSSTSLQALTDAVIYLTDYPYASSDALASRILAIGALRDVLGAFDVPGLPSPEALDAAVNADIDRLVALQNDDGGFSYWQRTRPSEPFNSIQATQALVSARDDGDAVPDAAIGQALAYVASIEQHIPATYSDSVRDTLSAYALNVRMLAGDRDAGKAEELFSRRSDSLSLDAVAWLWPVIEDESMSAEIERLFENRAVDTAGAATFTTDVADDAYVTLASDRRTDGLILDALIRLRPDSDLIPKVVNGLLASQTQGRWDNVQENAFILLALKNYFDTYESQTPDFVAKVWLGDQFAGDQQFSGRSTERDLISIPTAELVNAGDADLTISKEGTGRLYYRIGLRTAPDDLQLDPLDRGFVVARTYEAVDDPADVRRDADGTWHIKAGATVRVRLSMVAESQRTHVALIDPLPAGLEISNPSLAVTGDIGEDPSPMPVDTFDTSDRSMWWYPTWFDHQNMRDDRAEAFATFLGAGTYDYSYIARATTPGTFVTPPPRAEEIYTPETFGRGSTDSVVVDP